MRSIKAKLRKPTHSKDDWSTQDQRIWHSVAVNQPAKLAAKLGKHDNVNVNKLCPSVGYSVVHYAAAKGLDDCLNVLLANKANISTRDVTGATPLHASVRYGHKGATSKLLASPTVDVNATESNQCTALHFASFEGHLECVKLLEAAEGINIHCLDKEGRTALMVASAMGQLSVCKELIASGVNVNHKDSSKLQHSALTLAAEAGHSDVVRLLCEHGARYTDTLKDGRNALDLARSRSRRGVVDVLHIMQLTDAAKKSDRDSRRSISSILSNKTNDDADRKSERKKSRSDSHVETEDGVPYIDAVTVGTQQTNQSNDKPSEPTDVESVPTMSMYNDSKNMTLYDREVSLYDSKSTLASISSLDVTHDTSRTQSPSLARLNLDRSKNLDRSVEHSEILELMKEVEALKNLMQKNEAVVEDLKEENKSLTHSLNEASKIRETLSRDLEVANKKQKSLVNTVETERAKCVAQHKLNKTIEIKAASLTEELEKEKLRLSKLELENARLSQEKETEISSFRILLEEAVSEVGLPRHGDDYRENLSTLTKEIVEVRQGRLKKAESLDERKSEVTDLTKKLQDQSEEIELLQEQLGKSKTECENLEKEKFSLKNELDSTKENSQDARESWNERELGYIEDEKKWHNLLKEQKHENGKLREKIKGLRCELSEDQERSRMLWEEEVETLKNEMNELQIKLSDVKIKLDSTNHKLAESEKEVGELRVERNQREARISELGRELQKYENLQKENEVETNQARQQLTEAKQRCSELSEEVTHLKLNIHELNSKLGSLDLQYGMVEKEKINSMNQQLETLCLHIEESERKYKQTISVYRRHLLRAAKGDLHPQVMHACKEIIKLQTESTSTDDAI